MCGVTPNDVAALRYIRTTFPAQFSLLEEIPTFTYGMDCIGYRVTV